MSPQERAQRSADAMAAHDQASQNLGICLISIGPGTAQMSMEVLPSMLNGHGICHGGLIFTLADSCFAFACNSYNQVAVAQHNSINFIKPAHLQDRLIASACEVSRSGRTGLYDVRVINQQAEVIAEFRGQSRCLSGQHFTEETP